METLEITINGQKYITSNYYWEGNDFVFKDQEEKEYICKNCHWINLSFNGLDCIPDDNCFIFPKKESIDKNQVNFA